MFCDFWDDWDSIRKSEWILRQELRSGDYGGGKCNRRIVLWFQDIFLPWTNFFYNFFIIVV